MTRPSVRHNLGLMFVQCPSKGLVCDLGMRLGFKLAEGRWGKGWGGQEPRLHVPPVWIWRVKAPHFLG